MPCKPGRFSPAPLWQLFTVTLGSIEPCEKWTVESRKLLTEHIGKDAPLYREFMTANRQILTSFDTDPSYYLTQVVANLHRELRVLEKCVKEKDQEAAAAAAMMAVRGMKKARPKIPAFLWSDNQDSAKAVVSFLGGEDFDVTTAGPTGANAKETLWNVASRKELRYGIVVLGASKGKNAALSPDGLLVAGYLTGRLGRGRVLVLLETNQRLPAVAGILRTQALGEKATWQAEVKADAGKIRS